MSRLLVGRFSAAAIILAVVAVRIHGAVLTSAPFNFGYGYTGAGGGSWNTSETALTNTPTTQGLFMFSPAPTGDRFSSDGVTFNNRLLTDATGGNGYSGYITSLFAVPITASYMGGTPSDASTTPNYQLRIEISHISIYGGRHPSSTSSTDLRWEETTPGHAANSSPITLTTSNDYNEASAYTRLIWNPADFELPIAGLNSAVTRTFDIFVNGGGGDLRFIDGLEVQGTVSLVYDATPQTGVFRWQTSGLGDWNQGVHWDPAGVPNANSVDVVFGNEVNATTTVATNLAVTARSIQFDNANSYIVGGTGNVTLSANAGSAAINVLQGSHQFQAAVNLGSETDVSVAPGAALIVNNGLHFGGNNLNKAGLGTLQINSDLNTGTGAVNAQAGMISGVGLVSSDLNNTGAVVAPGASAGKLNVGDNYVQSGGGTLMIELGGTTAESQYDQIEVAGQATLGGALDVSLIDLGSGVFAPGLNDTFTILTAAGGRNGMFATPPSALPALGAGLAWQINYGANDVVLSVVSAGVPGDYNNNGVVDAADYVLWRSNPASLQNEGASLGTVDDDDYNFWRAKFGNTFANNLGAVQSVPEPGVVLPFLISGLVLLVSGTRSLPSRACPRSSEPKEDNNIE